MFEKILEGEEVAAGLFRVKKINKYGQMAEEYMWIQIRLTNIFDKNGRPICAVGLSEDVTRKINDELILKEKAHRDPLTNLMNRNSFQAQVQEFLKKGFQQEYLSALFIIDTDDFKKVNDTYGHVYGDEVLTGIASKLVHCFRTGDFIGRLGGDEFVIFMCNAKDVEAIEEKARNICKSLIFEKNDLITTCSVGVAIVSNQQEEYCNLYRTADRAMYEAKRQGKRGYVIYDMNQNKIEEIDIDFSRSFHKLLIFRKIW